MTEYQHPIRKQGTRTWAPHSGTKMWLAMFTDGKSWPIWFSGKTEAEALAELEGFRAKTIAENEARAIAHQKAKAARAAAKAAKGVPA